MILCSQVESADVDWNVPIRVGTDGALALAMPGNQISDFPLCNKSFNLSYCGFDL